MRTGKNPAKAGVPAYKPKELGIAIIIYIPVLEGYFKHSLQIFKYQLESIQKTTPKPYDLLVIDNGSCPQVVSELNRLRDEKWIDWLVLSRHNLGKAGAWNWIFASMPNELICYADSDVLFRNGWLEASLEKFDAFPRAGMVAAQPNFYDVMNGRGTAHLSLDEDRNYSFGDYWPENEVVDEYCYGIGADEELQSKFREKPLNSVRNQQTEVQAVVGASHMQFLTKREVIKTILPLPASKGLLRAETMSLDYKIDELGYLHLSTLKPYVFHMGNSINERLHVEIKKVFKSKQFSKPPAQERPSGKTMIHRWMAKLARIPLFNNLFLRIYNLLFQTLNTKD